jgi:hypothetical protein
MGVLFGLISALNRGVGDFCARFATTRIGNFRSYLYMQLAGLPILAKIKPPGIGNRGFYLLTKYSLIHL